MTLVIPDTDLFSYKRKVHFKTSLVLISSIQIDIFFYLYNIVITLCIRETFDQSCNMF